MKKVPWLLREMLSVAKKDLLASLPFLPIYAISQLFLAGLLTLATQLIFMDQGHISLIDLAPGGLKQFVPFNYTVSKTFLILIIPIGMVTIGFVKLISRFFINYFTEKAGHKTSSHLRSSILKNYLNTQGEILDKVHVERMVSQTMQDTSLLQSMICKGTIDAIRDLFILVGLFTTMFFISPFIFFMMLTVILPLGFLIKKSIAKINKYTKETLKLQTEQATTMLRLHLDKEAKMLN